MLNTKNSKFTKNWNPKHSHGGSLRKSRIGRQARPLSSKKPIHLVFNAKRSRIKGGFRTYKRYFLIQKLVEKYAIKFYVKIEQISIQTDHIHLMVRTTKRSSYQSFFRVVAGQIAQQFELQGLLTPVVFKKCLSDVTDTLKSKERVRPQKVSLWIHRPFTRIILGWKSYKICRDYIRLNEQEALGIIPFQKKRLRGLSSLDWMLLWGW